MLAQLPAKTKLMLALEYRARLNSYAYMGNGDLERLTGLPGRTLNYTANALEREGFVKRVYLDETKRNRCGFVMLKRFSNNGLEVADSPEKVAAAEHFLRTKGRSVDSKKLPSLDSKKLPSLDSKKLPQNKDSVLIRTKWNAASAADGAAAASTLSENRKDSECPATVKSREATVQMIEANPPTASDRVVEPIPAKPTLPTAAQSVEVAELAVWAKGVRPELEQCVLEWCLLLPVLWVRTAIEQRIVGRTPRSPVGLLARILGDWRRAGKCEFIPGSSLANPSARPPDPADKIQIFTDPRINKYFAAVHYIYVQNLVKPVEAIEPLVEVEMVERSAKFLRFRLDNPKPSYGYQRRASANIGEICPAEGAKIMAKLRDWQQKKAAERLANAVPHDSNSVASTPRSVGT